jgi:Raf kinase inhibitor-like YbhB/YbcL family protein
MELKSQAFQPGEMIPAKYTCDGPDVSPPLTWSDPPVGAKSLALISDDPDAPVGTWVHWVVWNIPATARSLEENLPKKESLPDGAKQGTTDFRRIGYGGPCPVGDSPLLFQASRPGYDAEPARHHDQEGPGKGHAGAYLGPSGLMGSTAVARRVSGIITSIIMMFDPGPRQASKAIRGCAGWSGPSVVGAYQQGESQFDPPRRGGDHGQKVVVYSQPG